MRTVTRGWDGPRSFYRGNSAPCQLNSTCSGSPLLPSWKFWGGHYYRSPFPHLQIRTEKEKQAGHQWLMPIILSTWEADEKIMVWG
jgi:hypothetical protein